MPKASTLVKSWLCLFAWRFRGVSQISMGMARAVDDLLTMLSNFGCQSSCYADTDLDDSVGVADLMNMLSVFGQGCSID